MAATRFLTLIRAGAVTLAIGFLVLIEQAQSAETTLPSSSARSTPSAQPTAAQLVRRARKGVGRAERPARSPVAAGPGRLAQRRLGALATWRSADAGPVAVSGRDRAGGPTGQAAGRVWPAARCGRASRWPIRRPWPAGAGRIGWMTNSGCIGCWSCNSSRITSRRSRPSGCGRIKG